MLLILSSKTKDFWYIKTKDFWYIKPTIFINLDLALLSGRPIIQTKGRREFSMLASEQ